MLTAPKPVVAAITVACALQQAATAAPLASESFDYATGTAVAGANGGSGWDGPWVTNADLDATEAAIVGGLSFGLYPVAGNALRIDQGVSDNEVVGFAGRPVGSGVSSGTLFASYLFRQTRDEGLPFGNGQRTFFGSSVSDGGIDQSFDDAKFQGQLSGSNGFGGPEGLNVATDKFGSAGEADYELPQDETFLAVLSYEPVGVPNFTSTGDPVTATLWIVDEADYAAIFAAGLSVASLDANNAAKAVEAGTIGSFGTPDLASGDLFRFFVQDAAVTFDEIRLGTSLSDVVAAPIPEPTALSGLGLLSVLGLRRSGRTRL